jgi:hypothetical protein
MTGHSSTAKTLRAVVGYRGWIRTGQAAHVLDIPSTPMTSLHEAAVLCQAGRDLAIVSTLRADHTVHSTWSTPASSTTLRPVGRQLAFLTAGPVKRAHLRARSQITVTFRSGDAVTAARSSCASLQIGERHDYQFDRP